MFKMLINNVELSCLSDMLSNYVETKLTDQTDNSIPVLRSMLLIN